MFVVKKMRRLSINLLCNKQENSVNTTNMKVAEVLSMTGISANIEHVRRSIAHAATKAGRKPQDVTLVAVTKTVPMGPIEEALQAGINHVGENRVQEAQQKYPFIGNRATWHLIGHLQTNKVKHAVPLFKLIHSVDRLALAEEISQQASKRDMVASVLVQINIAREVTKYGLDPLETFDFLEHLARLPGLKVEGLMTIAPYVENPEEVRPVFRELRQQAENIKRLNLPGVGMDVLSMGMTGDFMVAIEEGSTLVRIGTGIFGSRLYAEEGTT
jgi:PLP dependent protein